MPTLPNVRDETYRLLRALGLTTIFGNPGSTELRFLQDFPADFRYILGLHEGAVVSMADGYAQATGKAAFVNLHTAPGVGNALGAIIAAYYGKAPLVITAGQQVRPMMLMEPWLFAREFIEVPKPFVKWSYEPARAADVPGAIARAYHIAMQPPRGPVFVAIPMDDWHAACDPLPSHTVTTRVAPDPTALDTVTALLRESARPALVIGAGVDRAGARDAAIALAERTHAAVWGAPEYERAGFPEDHPQFVGFLPSAMAPLAEKLAAYDCVLALGAPIWHYYPYVPGPIVPEGTTLVQFTDDPDEAARAPAGMAVVGDVGLALAHLLHALPTPRTLFDASTRPLPTPRPTPDVPPATMPISPAFVMHTLDTVMPSDTVYFFESPSNRAAQQRHLRIRREGGYFVTPSGGLGYAMAAAVGAQIAQPERQAVALLGDGSSVYTIQALWTAAQEGAAAIFVIFNNGGYGVLKAFANFVGAHNVPGLEVPGLDLCQIARGFGCDAHRITHPEEIADALRAATAARVPTLLDITVDATVPDLVAK